MNKRSVSAWLVGNAPNELMDFKDYGDHVAVVNFAGQKFYFDDAQLVKAEIAMDLGKVPVQPYIQEMAALVKKPPEPKKRTKKAS